MSSHNRNEHAMKPANKPDAANRRQPLSFRKPVDESEALAFTAAVADPFR